ncbi:HNH endonuclease [Amycolatopsis sp. TNS106]|uniref:HNH endonuclease n=1 Tax=Amycolatopsis sp. TNS106 TaxID=2861750 RepID=UPI001C781649|nr:hypothetical protein CVV72_10465 [Amycolatopsis sp. TNS106]
MNVNSLSLLLISGFAVYWLVLLGILACHKRRSLDPRRFFSWTDKRVMITRARGRCEHKPLLWPRCPEKGTEADHIVPWSRGGPTALWNGQLLCRYHNRRKSNVIPGPLYRWRLQRRRRRY